jgi:hypothetical protein
VSHSLSPKYARLDGENQLSGSRLRFGNWPDVERLVLLWYQQTVNQGRHPSNEELAEKAKSIFSQLPRYKDETPPEFSPGWIHRFKKRYGLLIRRQRRHHSAPNPAEDIPYLIDNVPRFMTVNTDTSPAAIREQIQRGLGVDSSLATCARVRDEIVRRQQNPQLLANGHANGADLYPDVVDPEIALQNALRALQEEEADAEAQAAVAREERDRAERGFPPLGALAGQAYAQAAGALVSSSSTPARNVATTPARFAHTPGPTGAAGTPGPSAAEGDLSLTPIPSGGPMSITERPVRCPFCVNQRMLRTIKEAVEHLSSHVVV